MSWEGVLALWQVRQFIFPLYGCPWVFIEQTIGTYHYDSLYIYY